MRHRRLWLVVCLEKTTWWRYRDTEVPTRCTGMDADWRVTLRTADGAKFITVRRGMPDGELHCDCSAGRRGVACGHLAIARPWLTVTGGLADDASSL